MTGREWALLGGVVLAASLAQVLLRKAAKAWVTHKGVGAFALSFIKGPAPAALVLALGSPILYWKALESVPLSSAYAVTALSGVLVQLGGRLMLRERPSGRIVAGALLCCAGIAVWGL